MNDLTLGSFKFFGGKGYQQYDKEIMGRSDNWESFVRGVIKPEKDRREDRRDATIIASIKRKSEAEAAKATKGALDGMSAQIERDKAMLANAKTSLDTAVETYNNALKTNNQHAISEASKVLMQFANALHDNIRFEKGDQKGADAKKNLKDLLRGVENGVGVSDVNLEGQTFKTQLQVDFDLADKTGLNIQQVVKDAAKSSYDGVKLDSDKMNEKIENAFKKAFGDDAYKTNQIAGQVTSAIKSNLEAMQKELADIKAWKRKMG